MTRYAIKSVITAAACMTIAGLAFFSSAQARGNALDQCRKWTGEEGGEQIKCFDCLRAVGTGDHQQWVNICPPENNYRPN